MKVTRQICVQRKPRGRKVLDLEQSTPPAVAVPRVARLMASAIRFDHLIATGAVPNQAALARLGCVSRVRVTQRMNLLRASNKMTC